QHFPQRDRIRLQYTLHCYRPYDHAASLQPLYEAYRAAQAIKDGFDEWFLPLLSRRAKTGTPLDQRPAFARHYMRAHLAQPAEADVSLLDAVLHSISVTGTEWITYKQAQGSFMA
ncbi:hypothetical protein VM98_36165, partial [Streptomyces rubellomurinus subsp. indigoferus]